MAPLLTERKAHADGAADIAITDDGAYGRSRARHGPHCSRPAHASLRGLLVRDRCMHGRTWLTCGADTFIHTFDAANVHGDGGTVEQHTAAVKCMAAKVRCAPHVS